MVDIKNNIWNVIGNTIWCITCDNISALDKLMFLKIIIRDNITANIAMNIEDNIRDNIDFSTVIKIKVKQRILNNIKNGKYKI